jgi:hypothetical protein
MRVRAALVCLVAGCGGGWSQPAVTFDGTLRSSSTPLGPDSLVRVTNPDYNIARIAVSGDSVWIAVQWAGVYQLPKSGGVVAPIEVNGDHDFGDIAATASVVYWNHIAYGDHDLPHTSVKRRAAAGGAITTLLEDRDLGGLQPDGSDLYLDASGIARLSGSGGALQVIVPDAGDAAPPAPFGDWIVADTAIYMSNEPFNSPVRNLTTVAKSGGALQTIADLASARGAAVRAVDETNVYLASPVTEKGVWKVSRQGGAPVALYAAASVDEYVNQWLLVDGANVYFTTRDGSFSTITIQAVPKAGGPPTTIGRITQTADMRVGINQLAQDTGYLYLLFGPSEILRLAKVPSP